ncbi:MAG: DHH family phosphoesterase [Chitinivibrionales bacterium]
MTEKVTYAKKLTELHQRIIPGRSVLIITHDYPDPDCLASAFGISHLLNFWGIESSIISFGGFVGRAENRAMIRFLNIHTVPFMLVELSDFDRIVLVDSFPGVGNLSLPHNTGIDAVLDHHPHTPPEDAGYFHDIRMDLGATSTMVTQYLLAAGCDIPPKLATALFYGIKTDTNDMARHTSAEDLDCYKVLFDIMNHKILSHIESPDRDAEYFRMLHRATESMQVYNNVGYTHLGAVSTPDYIAEIADFFHCLENIEWMICSGLFKNQVFFSVRSKEEEQAGGFAEKIAHTLGGFGGGHSTMAAGRIPIDGITEEQMLEKFIQTFVKVLNVNDMESKDLLSL